MIGIGIYSILGINGNLWLEFTPSRNEWEFMNRIGIYSIPRMNGNLWLELEFIIGIGVYDWNLFHPVMNGNLWLEFLPPGAWTGIFPWVIPCPPALLISAARSRGRGRLPNENSEFHSYDSSKSYSGTWIMALPTRQIPSFLRDCLRKGWHQGS